MTATGTATSAGFTANTATEIARSARVIVLIAAAGGHRRDLLRRSDPDHQCGVISAALFAHHGEGTVARPSGDAIAVIRRVRAAMGVIRRDRLREIGMFNQLAPQMADGDVALLNMLCVGGRHHHRFSTYGARE